MSKPLPPPEKLPPPAELPKPEVMENPKASSEAPKNAPKRKPAKRVDYTDTSAPDAVKPPEPALPKRVVPMTGSSVRVDY